MPSTTKLNPLADIYTPISPGVISNSNSNPSFPEILHQVIPQTQQPQQVPYFTSQQFYSYYVSVQQPTCYFSFPDPQKLPNTSYYARQNLPTPPRLMGRSRFGSRKVVDGRTVSGQNGQRGGLSRAGGGCGRKEERIWVPERKVLGFERQMKKSSSKFQEVMPLKWDEEKTSVMIKNIPYDCPIKELIKVLDEFCKLENQKSNEEVVAYDFLYLPVDFRTNMSRGFAFVNFTNAKSVRKFFNAWNMVAFDSVHWRRWTKAIEIVTAKIQGKEALVGHFSGSVFHCESEEFLPVTFSPARDGSGKKVEATVVGHRRAFHQRWGTRKA